MQNDDPFELQYGKVSWMVLYARTNGFTLVADQEQTDGKRVAAGSSVPIPNIPMPQFIDTSQIRVKNTTAGANAVIEVIGFKEVN